MNAIPQFSKIHIEPALPSIVHLYEGLVQVYRFMKNEQPAIDNLFDRVASQIGFVVTTTLPIRAEVEDKGKVRSLGLDSEALRGTLFASEFGPFLEERKSRAFENVPSGNYRFFLVWSSALQLKFHAPDPSPQERVAEPIYSMLRQPQVTTTPGYEWMEPAHWFDPRVALAVDDVVAISAIDTVYPEFRLAERISANRGSLLLNWYKLVAESGEPVHPPLASRETLLGELKAILQKHSK